MTAIYIIGKRQLRFNNDTEFKKWKEREEEATYTTYVRRDRIYRPQASGKILTLHDILSKNTFRYSETAVFSMLQRRII